MSAPVDEQTHPDLPGEQAFLERAYACLAAMRHRAEYLKSLGYLGGNVTAGGVEAFDLQQWERDKQDRVDQLADPPTALCFGRIDRQGDAGQRPERHDPMTWYIGRRHVEDEQGNPLVTDWRTPVAVAFYRATVADTMDLKLRRRFLTEGRQLVDIFDEDLAHPGAVDAGAYVPDPLLAEVARSRSGEMRDIVATIAAEQDVIIRAPLESCVIVQGGPGTGKTAVGLHRAAFLLYQNREVLERQRLLIVGPNRIFLRYISQVLPSLGEEASVQLTIEGLAGVRYRQGEEDTTAAARLKGDRRMAEVVQRATFDGVTVPAADTRIQTSFGPVVLDAGAVSAVVTQTRGRSKRYSDGRHIVREQLVRLAWATHVARETADVTQQEVFEADVRSSQTFKRLLDKSWPTVTAAGVVRRLYSNRLARARATSGILDDAEAGLLARTVPSRAADQTWSRADLALLDEVETLISGVRQTYGHVVVDEAQDLSAMEFRMVTRRSPKRSMTVLGDLAQATSPGAQTDWQQAASSLEVERVSVEELTIGYRVPEPVMAFANRLLPYAAPGLRPPSSVRQAGSPPRITAAQPDRLAAVAAREVAEVAGQWSLTGVVAPDSLRVPLGEALKHEGVAFVDGTVAAAIGDHVTLLPPASAKGLEFDAVVVVEPARIVAEADGNLRLLYVVLTRAVQHLSVVHADPLPVPLRTTVEESEAVRHIRTQR